jgi:hypothetical protein
MAWMNLMAHRPFRLRYLAESLEKPETLVDFFMIEPAGRAAIELGDRAALARLVEISRSRYDAVLRDDITPKLLTHFTDLSVIVTWSCFYHFAGEDQSARWRTLLQLPGEVTDPSTRALLGILATLDEPVRKPARARKLRYPRTEKEFLRDLGNRSTAESLDITNSPDHPAYPDWMGSYVLPLALKRSRELGTDPITPASMGAWPERRGELLYGRTVPRPPYDTKVNPDDPKTYTGFDALERKGEELLAYHYVGIAWKAPLAFEAGLNAFTFLESLPCDWRQVRENVSAENWGWIARAREEGRCTHVVVYDPTEAGASEGAVKAAGEHYGVRLVAKGLFDV